MAIETTQADIVQRALEVVARQHRDVGAIRGHIDGQARHNTDRCFDGSGNQRGVVAAGIRAHGEDIGFFGYLCVIGTPEVRIDPEGIDAGAVWIETITTDCFLPVAGPEESDVIEARERIADKPTAEQTPEGRHAILDVGETVEQANGERMLQTIAHDIAQTETEMVRETHQNLGITPIRIQFRKYMLTPGKPGESAEHTLMKMGNLADHALIGRVGLLEPGVVAPFDQPEETIEKVTRRQPFGHISKACVEPALGQALDPGLAASQP